MIKIKNTDDLLLWAKFINAERKEEFEMLSQKNEAIEKAYRRLQVISQDKEKRLEYEAREKAVRDYNQGMKEATERGIEIGEKRGEKRGIEIGEKRGIEIGKIGIAKKLFSFGMTTEDIAEATGLTAEQVEELRKQS